MKAVMLVESPTKCNSWQRGKQYTSVTLSCSRKEPKMGAFTFHFVPSSDEYLISGFKVIIIEDADNHTKMYKFHVDDEPTDSKTESKSCTTFNVAPDMTGFGLIVVIQVDRGTACLTGYSVTPLHGR